MSAEKPEVSDVWGVRGPQNSVLITSAIANPTLKICLR